MSQSPPGVLEKGRRNIFLNIAFGKAVACPNEAGSDLLHNFAKPGLS